MEIKEIRDGVYCVLAFGATGHDAYEEVIRMNDFPKGTEFTSIINPIPTGNHWKAIEWAKKVQKKGRVALIDVPKAKRQFAITAGAALKDRKGIRLEISNTAARVFRDRMGYRGERGKVYAFFKEQKVI